MRSRIRVDLRDEIFQAGVPVLVGVDAASTYCYLLELAEHRDADTWGYYLLEAQSLGLAPERTIADVVQTQVAPFGKKLNLKPSLHGLLRDLLSSKGYPNSQVFEPRLS